MTRRSAAKTRQLLLDTGVEMLYEAGISPPVAHIRLQNVLRRAGLTTGAAYRIWATQEDFQHDLAEEATLRRVDDRQPANATETAISDLLAEGAPLDEVIRVATNNHIRSYTESPPHGPDADQFLTNVALRASAALGSDQLRRASLQRHDQAIESFMALYAALAEVYGLRLRDRYELRDFAVVVAALGEGFAIQAIEGEEVSVLRVPGHDGVEREWSPFGRAVFACIGEFFEAGPGDEVG